MEPNRDHLVRYAPFDLRRPHGIRHGWRALRARPDNAEQVDPRRTLDRLGLTQKVRSDDIDPDEVTGVLLYVAAVLGFLLFVAIGAAAVFAVGALRHWA